jgi:hypothetical protein
MVYYKVVRLNRFKGEIVMAKQGNYNATVLRITGVGIDQLYFLSNVYPRIFDPDAVTSMIATLAYKPNVKWETIFSVETWLTSMDQSKGGNIFVVSMDGELHSNRAGKWEMMDLNCPEGLNDVWACSDDEIFSVGIRGDRVHLIGSSLEVTRDKLGRRLNAVHGTSNNNVFAVGDQGLIMRFDGTNWIELEAPTNYNLLAVLCPSKTETYVAGTEGILLKWDGRDWELQKGPNITITGLAWYRNALYAAAGGDGVYVLGSKGLEKIKDVQLYRLRTIADLLFGCGNKLVARYDGAAWRGGELDLV